MKVSELFRYVIERGMERDPRGKEGLDRFLADAGKEGISEAVLDATFDLATAVMAGIGQSMNQRYKNS